MPTKPTLILDADDTLWENEIYYEQCIAEFAELMAAQGFDLHEAQQIANEVEHERVPLVGYGPIEFARNLVIAYERLCSRHARPVEEDVANSVWQAGQLVMEPPMALLDGVAETVPKLAEHFQLLMLTKGDRQVQERKLARSGLESFFEGVRVVPEKNAQVLQQLMADYGLRPERTWMVGNSPRSDINPALEAGAGAVYIPYSRTWALEQGVIADAERVIVLHHFGELLTALTDSS